MQWVNRTFIRVYVSCILGIHIVNRMSLQYDSISKWMFSRIRYLIYFGAGVVGDRGWYQQIFCAPKDTLPIIAVDSEGATKASICCFCL